MSHAHFSGETPRRWKLGTALGLILVGECFLGVGAASAQTCSPLPITCHTTEKNSPFCYCPDTPDANDCVAATVSWTNGVIPYAFGTEGVDENFKTLARNAMADWSTATFGFITFTEVTDPANPPPIFALLSSATNGANVGMIPGSGAGFGPIKAYHELGHLIGLPHEFERYDRDHYMAEVHTQTIACGPRCPTPDDPYGPFSFRSTMMYQAGYPDFTRWDFSSICSGQTCASDNALICQGAPPSPDDMWFTPKCTTCWGRRRAYRLGGMRPR